MIRRRLCFSALVVALGVTAAACGSSGGDHASQASAAPPAPASSPTRPPSPSRTSSPNGAAASSDGSDFCDSAGPANPALALAAAQSGGPDVATLKSDIQHALAAAPPEIKPDVQTMADVELPILDGKVAQNEIEQQLAGPGFERALHHISTWSAAHCH